MLLPSDVEQQHHQSSGATADHLPAVCVVSCRWYQELFVIYHNDKCQSWRGTTFLQQDAQWRHSVWRGLL